MVKEFRARRDLFVDGLNAIPGVRCRHAGGRVLRVPQRQRALASATRAPLHGSVQISEILLDDFRVAAVPGQPFGAEGFMRMSFATSRETIEKGLARLRDFVATLTA